MDEKLIEIIWHFEDQGVDHLIPLNKMDMIFKHKEEVIETLRYLADKLEREEYPFIK